MADTSDSEKNKQLARTVFRTEAQAILSLEAALNASFFHACDRLAACTGRIVVTGIGKSGHIAGKIAATMASTGSPAFYLHPAEANHGDFGMLKRQDIAVLLSHSGETTEIIALLPALKRMKITIVAITAKTDSTLSRAADLHIDTGVHAEACPLGLAPTASSTATLAVGDALALVVAQIKGFTAEDFAKSHPGGKLGKRLLLRIEDIMHTGAQIPTVTAETLLADALYEMSSKRLGMTLIVQNGDRVIGIFTDGDLRRALHGGADIQKVVIRTVMTSDFHAVTNATLAIEALHLMERHAINAVPVLDAQQRLIGALNIHDLLNAGL